MATFDLLNLWAKKSDDDKDHYPLLCHMMDAAAVADQIWQNCLHQSAKRFVASELQLSDNEFEAGKWLSFFVGLHDFGKATPDFQGESEKIKGELEKSFFKFNRKPMTYHGVASACLLPDFFKEAVSIDFSKKVAIAIGGHHGTFPRSEELQETRRFLGNGQWNTIRTELYNQMVESCQTRDRILPNSKPGNALFMFLAGLTSVADWIASNELFFPISAHDSYQTHIEYAKHQAANALKTLHWTGWKPAQTDAIFTDLFKDANGKSFVPRPLQNEVINLAENISEQPGLVIIEAPMGEGKTEAAIYLADKWVTNRKQRGYYFALPTMATSDQMFGRVKAYLTKRYPSDSVNLMLLHGHASLSTEFEAIKDKFEIRNVASDDPNDKTFDSVNAGVVASEWFTSRKRGLLSPFGVGTIDQSLLAVLQTRHVFVRLFGLAHKTIIIDEVHAYDAYMSTLLERLLEWLAALGSSVVLLSATLPKTKRDALLQAYQKGLTGKEILFSNEVDETKYPRISWTNDCESHSKTIGNSLDTTKELNIRMVNGDLPENGKEYILGKLLREALSDGGCSAVICNTVDQAQKVYQQLKSYFPVIDAGDGSPELDLLHARYLYGDRQERENRTITRFGKDRMQRPQRAVLVATQIIEQSLDIDFDLMVTEMAPVDLLLQRSGRMHRHKVDSKNMPIIRPEKLKQPTLWVCRPEVKDGVPFFGGGTEAIYDYHILLRSWMALIEFVDKKPVKIPDDVEGLIEKVYDEKIECPDSETTAIKSKWKESGQKLHTSKKLFEKLAISNSIYSPDNDIDEIFEDKNKKLEEDDPTINETMQALTRISEEPSLTVICLVNDKLEGFAIDTEIYPDNETTKKLLYNSVNLARKGLIPQILKEREQWQVPLVWRKNNLLRHCYILHFSQENDCSIGSWLLKLNTELGLLISNIKE